MENSINFKNRNIAITDLETTGLDLTKHEIIEIGLVLVRQPDLEIIDTLAIKVRPDNIIQADPKALEINGYKDEDWSQAYTLKEAMTTYMSKVENSIFCAHNTSFDLPFLKQACVKTNISNTLDYHCIDVPTLVWLKFRNSELERLNLSKVAEFMGLHPEPDVHRAINGAMLAYEVLKKIVLEGTNH